jgi:hypothetical protein
VFGCTYRTEAVRHEPEISKQGGKKWVHIQYREEFISDLKRFFGKEIMRVVELLQEIKTADQCGTTLL